jgi:hypothetical protein
LKEVVLKSLHGELGSEPWEKVDAQVKKVMPKYNS